MIRGILRFSYGKYSRGIIRLNSTESKTASFGFQKVSEEDKRVKVMEVFDNVAEKYDVMNDLMSAGVHRIWKNIFIQRLNPTGDMKLLDVAGGTGDIAFRFLRAIEEKEKNLSSGIKLATVCDLNSEMLKVGKKRSVDFKLDEHVDFIEGNAEELPCLDSSFDAYTIAFGIRNVVKIDKALKEAHRVLKPGGVFMCLEFSFVTTPMLASLYDAYSFNVIPPMGEIVAGDWESYQYLVESIRQFPKQEEFASLIREAGFKSVRYENLFDGIAAIHVGFKY